MSKLFASLLNPKVDRAAEFYGLQHTHNEAYCLREASKLPTLAYLTHT
jgi:hypothetical protein